MTRTRAEFHDPKAERRWSIATKIIITIMAFAIGSSIIKIITKF